MNGLADYETAAIATLDGLATATAESPSARPIVSERQVVAQVVSEDPFGTLGRLAAKARIVERISVGDVKVIAAELRADLEALCGPCAMVVDLAARRRDR